MSSPSPRPATRRVLVIGIGAGDPNQITLQAIEAMRRADLFLIPGKGEEKAELARAREALCARLLEPGSFRTAPFAMPVRRAAGDAYGAAVADWHDAMADIYERLLRDELGEGETGAFLVWGDPALYDSTLRILDRLEKRGLVLDVEVIPGITAVQALAARHGVALNAIGQAVVLSTGRRLREDGWPQGAESLVIMLDGELSFRSLEDDCLIWWGANLGLSSERLVAGPLREVADRIASEREAARKETGWVMDTYLLRKR